MRHIEAYELMDLHQWDVEVNAAAQKFYEKHGIYPNILMANPSTFEILDVVAINSNVFDENGKNPPAGSYPPLKSFLGNGYFLALCTDKKCDLRCFLLIYDPNFK